MSLNERDHRLIAHTQALEDECLRLSDRLFDLAETAYDEYASVERQIDLLRQHGFVITRDIGGLPTAFVAEAGSGGPVIGLLGEYDALPQLSQQAGVWQARAACVGAAGHGCGHHLLGGATVLAALALQRWLAETGRAGRVRYHGCPAEEGGAGKTFLVRAGAFDELDAALTWHPASILALDAMSSLATLHARFRFTVRAAGSAEDTTATPQPGGSARDAVMLMNVGANYLREHIASDARLHYAVIDAGGNAPDVVQASSEVVYQIRAARLGEVRALYQRLHKIAEGAALMSGTHVLARVDKAMSNMRPNGVLSDLLYARMAALGPVPFDAVDRALAAVTRGSLRPEDIGPSLAIFGAEGIADNLHSALLPRERMPALLPASTDVGDVSWVTPTARFMAPCFVVGTPFHSWSMVAQGKSTFAHKGMVHAARILALGAGALFDDPALLRRARAELEAGAAQEAYVCPIPQDIAPPLKPRRATAEAAAQRSER
ncbi:amidohydrolase [Aquabacterium sp.]|uniref:amidohydrolase n=1 Tax=Aquabacterium sp. TaxID=1872578 RepID=UPI002C7ABB97|nr:amidohydrolase [Aquabacterium sp.]HSW04676.1 amidohydrolase [Aquabacterium sp.]